MAISSRTPPGFASLAQARTAGLGAGWSGADARPHSDQWPVISIFCYGFSIAARNPNLGGE